MVNKNIYLISLGCPKNLVDAEHLLGRMVADGWRVVEEPDQAEAILVNTCSFIEAAVSESVEHLLEASRLKREGRLRALVAFGCLPQRYRSELAEAMPEVDLWWGSGAYEELPSALSALLSDGHRPAPDWDRRGFLPVGSGARLRSAPFYRAYLKIAEGCSNRCSYCIIPRLRGPYRSRPLTDLVEEARGLAAQGVRELILVAQDTTAYGRDLGGGDLAELLDRLADVAGLRWLRIMYAYPEGVTDDLLSVMAGRPEVCPYLDLPLQHASRRVLRRMGRRIDEAPLDLVERIRSAVPGISLRTTVMVGFPGETEADFQALLDFVQRASFDSLGAFKFSAETGVAAAGFPDQVPQRAKENRRRKIMAVQRRIARAKNRTLIGQTVPVLVEGRSEETDLLLVGRTRGQAPEVDGVVYINRGRASAGDIVPVGITEAHDYDLVGGIAGPA
jgi:ribosomal protein S12 methylthiotransferase